MTGSHAESNKTIGSRQTKPNRASRRERRALQVAGKVIQPVGGVSLELGSWVKYRKRTDTHADNDLALACIIVATSCKQVWQYQST